MAGNKGRKMLCVLCFDQVSTPPNVVLTLNTGWRKCWTPGVDTSLVIFQIQLAPIDGDGWSVKWVANLICGSQMTQMVACDFDYWETGPHQRALLQTVITPASCSRRSKPSPAPYLQGSSLEGGCQGYNHATVLLLGYSAFLFLSACEVQSEKDKGGTDDIRYI